MKLKQETKVILIAMAGIYVLFNVLRIFFMPDRSLVWHLELSVYGLVLILFLGFCIRMIDIQMDKYLPFERNIMLRIVTQVVVTFMLVVVLRYFLVPVVMRVFNIAISHDLYIVSYFVNLLVVVILILSIFGYHFLNRWKQAQIQQVELEREKALIQYDNLKNQLNPHFLFNSLSSLNSLIFENPQLASEFLQQLSKVYRYLLSHKDKSLVLLDKEVDFVTHYVNLLKTRFDDGVKINFDIPEGTKEMKIVPVTIQILLENALKHNIAMKDAPLQIDIVAGDGYLTVRNNLQVRATEISNKLGLGNLKNLYRYISSKPVIIEQAGGYFTVKVPLVT